MKIVHISLCGPVTDGWNYQDNLIPKYQVLADNDVTIIASKWIFGNDGKLTIFDKTDYYYDGIKMIRLNMKSGRDINSKFKRYEGLYEAITGANPDCIFVHNISFIDVNDVVRYARENPDVRIYADNHNDFSNSGRNWISKNILQKGIWRHYARKIEPYVKKFYGVLPARVDFLVNVYGLSKEKCELLVMGADDELVSAAKNMGNKERIRKQYSIQPDDFLIMTGGKIDAFKTQTLLLMQAVHNINNPKVKLIVFGSIADELKEQVDNLADDNIVQYIGWINANDSYEYFACADLAVFPGRHSVFWEQVVGQGIPMICKKWDGTTHVDICGNVIFLEEDSVEIIQKQIELLINDREKYKTMKQAAIEASSHFSYREISRKCIE